jgi:hypothetical protein
MAFSSRVKWFPMGSVYAMKTSPGHDAPVTKLTTPATVRLHFPFILQCRSTVTAA